ncbi:MAG: hypothetical protein ACK5CY_02770 [Bacteroidia bacterium]
MIRFPEVKIGNKGQTCWNRVGYRNLLTKSSFIHKDADDAFEAVLGM